jgi:hypothetical protein
MKGRVEPCNANSGKGSVNSGTNNHIDCKDATNDNSTRDTTKGAKAWGTTNDISTRETTKGAELRS